MRDGGWQHTLGGELGGKTLGILGLGNVGSGVAAAGARVVSKEELLRTTDVISIHMVLSARTIGLIGAAEFALMKPSARLVNT